MVWFTVSHRGSVPRLVFYCFASIVCHVTGWEGMDGLKGWREDKRMYREGGDKGERGGGELVWLERNGYEEEEKEENGE